MAIYCICIICYLLCDKLKHIKKAKKIHYIAFDTAQL